MYVCKVKEKNKTVSKYEVDTHKVDIVLFQYNIGCTRSVKFLLRKNIYQN